MGGVIVDEYFLVALVSTGLPLSGKEVRRVIFYMNRRCVFHEPAAIVIHSVSGSSMVTNDATRCVQQSRMIMTGLA